MYSKEEIKGFEAKDLRINRVALLKSLIESGRNSVNEIAENKEIAEQYVGYIYNGVTGIGVDTGKDESINWVDLALELNLAIPNGTNVKVLNALWDEYKNIAKASAKPAALLIHIIDKFGKFPSKPDSIELVLDSLKKSHM